MRVHAVLLMQIESSRVRIVFEYKIFKKRQKDEETSTGKGSITRKVMIWHRSFLMTVISLLAIRSDSSDSIIE